MAAKMTLVANEIYKINSLGRRRDRFLRYFWSLKSNTNGTIDKYERRGVLVSQGSVSSAQQRYVNLTDRNRVFWQKIRDLLVISRSREEPKAWCLQFWVSFTLWFFLISEENKPEVEFSGINRISEFETNTSLKNENFQKTIKIA